MHPFPETIPDLLAWRATRAPGRSWLSFEGQSWTIADVIAEAERYAVFFAERGVVKGDRVAVLLDNRPETLFAWFGANQLGAIFVPLNPAFKPPELAGLLSLTRPRALVVDRHRGLAEAACAALGAPPTLIAPDEIGKTAGATRANIVPDDVAVLLGTSGTTGAPKAVAQTHRAYTLTAEAFPEWLGLDESDRLMIALPLFHINAQAYSTMGALGAGAGLSLLGKFSASRFWQDARELDATEVNAVGAMLRILAKREPSRADRDHRVRLCYAALALPEAEHRAFEERFGLELTVGYGLSETPFGTIWPRGEAPRYGSIGRLRQHPRLGEINRARVVSDDGRDVGEDEVGELWLANPAIAASYWGGDAVIQAGWFRTGDLVRCDADGFYSFVSRKKDVIRRRGENVSPAEIENVLLAHPSVLEAAVLGVPSELGEDDIVAYVAPHPSERIDVGALSAFVRERLADFKQPTVIHVRDSLPRTATERVAKHLLK